MLKMERDLNQYFPPDSIFRFDDDNDFSETQNGEKSDPSEEVKGNGDVFVSRKDTSRETTQTINLANYFSQDSIYRSSDDENDEIRNGVQIRSNSNSPQLRARGGMEPKNTGNIKIENNFSPGGPYRSPEEENGEGEQVKIRSKPKSPRQQVDLKELQDMVLPTFSGDEKLPPKTPKIKIENIDDGSFEEIIYDRPPPPLHKKNANKRITFQEERQRTDNSFEDESSLKKRGSCPGFFGTWERYSLLNPKYDNLLADEGLESSGDYELVSHFSKSDSHSLLSRKKSLKEMLLTVFPNRIYLSLSDNEIDTSKEDLRLPGKTKKRNKKNPCTFRHMKELMSSKCKDLRSTVGAVMRGGSNCSLQLVSTFCVPAGCANVSSITKYDHGRCWVAADQSESILLYDREGNLVDLVNAGCPVDSLTTDKDGNVFMSCPDLKEVRVFDRNRHVSTSYVRGLEV